MRLKDWLKAHQHYFKQRDLRFLMKNVLHQVYPYTCYDETLDAGQVSMLEDIVHKYNEGVPLAYLLGKEEFYGLEFEVNGDVLIPRKETEILVEKAVDIIKERNYSFIHDLCCGCGNIAITIKNLMPSCIVSASDISTDALKMAQKNALAHKTEIQFSCSDLLDCFQPQAFDLIIANPPYVEGSEIDKELSFEPRLALEADNAGFSVIARIVKCAGRYVREQGVLIVEIGYNHKQFMYNVLENSAFSLREWIQDYDGNFRGAVLELKSK